MGRGRAPCCDKVGLNKGSWAPEEDMRLVAYIHKFGHGNWRSLPKQAGLRRCGKSCRLRWINYLCPDIKRGNFTKEEEETIINLHGLLGNKWSKIASHLPGRTDNEIKNLWNTHLKKRSMAPNRVAEEPATSSSSTLSSVSCSDQVGLNKEDDCKNPNTGMQYPSLCSLDSSATTCNNEMDLLVEIADIPIEPGLMEDDVPGLFNSEVRAMDDHQHPTRLERESSGEGESEFMRWLANLEFDLDLWGTSEERQRNQGAWVEMEGDPVSIYFQT